MRDKVKGKAYFEAFLLDNDEEIANIEALLENLPKKTRLDFVMVKNFYSNSTEKNSWQCIALEVL